MAYLDRLLDVRFAAAIVAFALVAAAAAFAAPTNLVLAGSIGLVVAALTFPRPHFTLAALVLANYVVVAKGPVNGTALSNITHATTFRDALTALFALQGARALLAGRVHLARALLPLAPLIAVILLSIVAAPFAGSKAADALPFCALLVGAFLLAEPMTADAASIRRMVQAVAIACLVVAVLNMVLAPFANQPADNEFQVIHGFVQSAAGQRFQGILENPNTVGIFGTTAFPVLLAAGLLERTRSAMRRIYFAGAALVAIEVFLSISRSGMIALVIAGVALGTMLTRDRAHVRTIALSTLVIAALLVVLAGAVGGLVHGLRLSSLASGSGRTAIWPHVEASIGQRPLLGFGYGSEQDVVASYGTITSNGTTFVGQLPGNVILDAGVQTGVLGILAYIFAVGRPLLASLRMSSATLTREQRVVRLMASAMVIGGVVSAFGESYSLTPGGASVVGFWFAVGLCWAIARRGRAFLTMNHRASTADARPV